MNVIESDSTHSTVLIHFTKCLGLSFNPFPLPGFARALGYPSVSARMLHRPRARVLVPRINSVGQLRCWLADRRSRAPWFFHTNINAGDLSARARPSVVTLQKQGRSRPLTLPIHSIGPLRRPEAIEPMRARCCGVRPKLRVDVDREVWPAHVV